MTTSESPRVVHIDDDAALLDLDETYLRRLPPFGVTTCSDPKVTFDIVCDPDIDYAVSDCDMPAMTRVEPLETVREDHGSFLLIPLTGRGSEEVAGGAISAGATDYLRKQPSSEQYELFVNRTENNVSEHWATRRAECYKAVLETLSYPVYVVDERGRFEYVNDTFADHGDSEVTVTVGRTHDGLYVEGDGDGLLGNRSPEKRFEADGSRYRGGGPTHRRRLGF